MTMLVTSRRRAFLACVSVVVAHNLVHCCSAAPAGNAAPSHDQQEQTVAAPLPLTGEQGQALEPTSFLEGKNPASQVAALSQNEQAQPLAIPTDPLKGGVRRRLGSNADAQDTQPHRRLAILESLSQLTQPFSAFSGLLGGGMSARDKDALETFARRVANSRERIYKDLLFVTGGRQQGLDEFAMKQLIAKVGLENLASGQTPSHVQLSRPESAVLDVARRSRFHLDRIIATYEREVAQHAKSLRNELQTSSNQQSIQAKIDTIISEGLFKNRSVSVRRLQQTPRLRRLAALLDANGLFGAAGSLFRSMNPSNLTHSLSAGLGGLGLHHLRLPNVGGLGIGYDGHAPLRGIQDGTALLQALQSVFLPQQANALSAPLLAFQQGVSTATDGAIGAFLSKEGLLPFLSVDTTKQLLGSLIGGEAIAPHGASGWESLGFSPAAVKGLAAIMPFEMFLNKLGALAQEVDADVGVLRMETKKNIGAGGFALLPEQLSEVDHLLDRLVWGTLQAPVRRLQVDDAAETQQHHQQQPESQQQAPQQSPEVQQQPAEAQQRQPENQHQQHTAAAQQQVVENGKQPADGQQQQNKAGEVSMDNLLDALLYEENTEESADDQMEAALQRVELLADAVTVLLKEYERAVEQLQKLLDDQVEAAEDIRDELEEQVEAFTKQVQKQKQKPQQPREAAAAAAAAQVAKAYDEAMEGLRTSLDGMLQQQQQQQPILEPLKQELGALAAKIETAAEEGVAPMLAAH